MSQFARVDSIDVIRHFRTAMWKFAETANVALGDAESEIHRTLNWLENEQLSFWEHQVRKRGDAVVKAKEVVRHKKLFKTAINPNPSTVEEEKALRVCQKRLEEAEQKLVNVKKHTRQLRKELQLYKGSVQRFATAVESDIPVAVSRLDRMTAALQAYVALGPAVDPSGARGDAGAATMARGLDLGPGEDNYAALRALVLTAKERDALPRGDASIMSWPVPLLSSRDSQLLESFKLPARPIDPQGRIIIASNAWNDPRVTRIFLHRMEDPGPGDSGWYVGVAEYLPSGNHEAYVVAELLAQRPELAAIFELPPGCLAVVDSGLTALLTKDDKDLVSAPRFAPEKEAEKEAETEAEKPPA